MQYYKLHEEVEPPADNAPMMVNRVLEVLTSPHRIYLGLCK